MEGERALSCCFLVGHPPPHDEFLATRLVKLEKIVNYPINIGRVKQEFKWCRSRMTRVRVLKHSKYTTIRNYLSV